MFAVSTVIPVKANTTKTDFSFDLFYGVGDQFGEDWTDYRIKNNDSPVYFYPKNKNEITSAKSNGVQGYLSTYVDTQSVVRYSYGQYGIENCGYLGNENIRLRTFTAGKQYFVTNFAYEKYGNRSEGANVGLHFYNGSKCKVHVDGKWSPDSTGSSYQVI